MKIEIGQIWLPYDNTDYTLEILDITTEEVIIKQLETGEIYPHELDGSDGFEDYLETLLYRLKT
jgi:hypothetical protein